MQLKSWTAPDGNSRTQEEYVTMFSPSPAVSLERGFPAPSFFPSDCGTLPLCSQCLIHGQSGEEAVCNNHLGHLAHTSSPKHEDLYPVQNWTSAFDLVDHVLNFNGHITTHCEGNLRSVAQLLGMFYTAIK